MLVVVLRSFNLRGHKNEIQCHIPFHNGSMPPLNNEEIDFIQADGDELDEILKCFQSIPIPIDDGDPKRVCRWYGEMASFIYFNIR